MGKCKQIKEYNSCHMSDVITLIINDEDHMDSKMS
jgi:hypothetical protein